MIIFILLCPIIWVVLSSGQRLADSGRRAFLLSLIFVMMINAQSAGTDLEFINLGTGARPLGLGNAYTSLSNDANSVYWNPAGMNQLSTAEAIYMHRNLYFDTDFDYLAAGLPLTAHRLQPTADTIPHTLYPINYLGLGFIRVSTGDIKITDTTSTLEPGTDYNQIVYRGTGGYTASAYFLSYGRKIKQINTGITIRIMDMRLLEHAGRGYGIDLGLLVPYKFLTYGLMLRGINFGKIKWDTGQVDDIVPVVRTGITLTVGEGMGYRVWGMEKEVGSKKGGLIITGEIEQEIKAGNQAYWHNPKYHIGLEWSIMGLVGIRCGYDDGNFSGGIGFRSEHIYVDYAYTTHPELNGMHSISIGIR